MNILDELGGFRIWDSGTLGRFLYEIVGMILFGLFLWFVISIFN